MPFAPTPLELPEPRPIRFERTPLALVVCQIRFEHLGSPDPEAAKALKEALADAYPVAQPQQSIQIEMGPGAPMTQATRENGWRFSSIDQKWSASVLPDALALETTAYVDWEDFDQRLRAVLDAVQRTLSPRVEVRLGLRYVNEIRVNDVEAPSDWQRYLRSELVALTTADEFASSAFSAQQTVQVAAGENAVLNMRHGFPGLPDGSLNEQVYLMDFDCFREGQRALEVEGLLKEADRFNTMITSLFQWCLTEALWKELEPHDK
jgi:uncharacterized protein (TIGR04255 family)